MLFRSLSDALKCHQCLSWWIGPFSSGPQTGWQQFGLTQQGRLAVQPEKWREGSQSPNRGFELGYCVTDMAVEGLLTMVHGEDRLEGHCCFDISGCKSLIHYEEPVHAELLNGVRFGAKGVNLLRHLLQLLLVAVGLSLVEVEVFGQVLGYSPSC